MNNVKFFEKNQKTSFQNENISKIIESQSNEQIALRGIKTKTMLYVLFSVIAALELSAALYFYMAGAFGVSMSIAIVSAVIIACFFHYLTHSVLSDTALGLVFSKSQESRTMQSDIVFNVILSLSLLIVAAVTVSVLGKKGFSAWRANKYETQTQKNGKDSTPKIGVEMLTNAKGKISTAKLEALADVQKSAANQEAAITEATKEERLRYDKTTEQVVDIVGGSAFAIEFLLALLAYAIATAKKNASIAKLAEITIQQNSRVVIPIQETTQPSHFLLAKNDAQIAEYVPKQQQPPRPEYVPQTPQQPEYVPQTPRRQIGFFKEIDERNNDERNNDERNNDERNNDAEKLDNQVFIKCKYCENKFTKNSPKHVFCCDECRVKYNEEAKGYKVRFKKKDIL